MRRLAIEAAVIAGADRARRAARLPLRRRAHPQPAAARRAPTSTSPVRPASRPRRRSRRPRRPAICSSRPRTTIRSIVSTDGGADAGRAAPDRTRRSARARTGSRASRSTAPGRRVPRLPRREALRRRPDARTRRRRARLAGRAVAPRARDRPLWSYGYDDGPALAVDPRGTVYVAFQRSFSEHRATTVVSRSDDHGRTWSRAGRDLARARPPASRVARRRRRRPLRRPGSTRGSASGSRAPPTAAAPSARPARRAGSCRTPAARLLARRHLAGAARAGALHRPGSDGARPRHTRRRRLRRRRPERRRGRVRDAARPPLRLRFRGQVNPPDGGHATRQFMPVAAVDAGPACSGRAGTTATYGDGGHAWFTCAASRTGARWSAPVRAAASPPTRAPSRGRGASTASTGPRGRARRRASRLGRHAAARAARGGLHGRAARARRARPPLSRPVARRGGARSPGLSR